MHPDPSQTLHFLAIILGFYALFFLAILVAIVVPVWFICKKAGFSPWLAFLVIVPFGGLVLLYVLAFADWKVIPAPQFAYMPPYYPPQPPIQPPAQPPLPPQI
jgi:hypothetical protein